MAEEERFELSNGFPSPVFKTGAFSHSATPPHFILYSFGFRKRPEQLMGRSIGIVTELAKLFFRILLKLCAFMQLILK